MPELTQARLKELLHYNAKTGIFTWVADRHSGRVGKVAGCINKADGYLHLTIDRKVYKAHRLAWFYVHGEWPEEIDHIKHDKVDNRIKKMRSVSHSENQKNRLMGSNNKSGFNGVSKRKRGNVWTAYIQVDGVKINLGEHATFSRAVGARKAANKKYGFHENHGRKASFTG